MARNRTRKSARRRAKDLPGLGWKPALPDHRDRPYATLRHSSERVRRLPAHVDLRSGFPPVYNQGNLNACTAHVIAAAFEFDRRQKKLPDFMPSRLFIYWNERDIEGATALDHGANIRDGIKVWAKQGLCEETHWPYKVSRFARKPPKACYRNALRYEKVNYYFLDNADLDELKSCLAAGYPFLFGYGIWESFFNSDDNGGIVSMPEDDEPIVGGHAVLGVGYSDRSKRFIIRSSWGTARGDEGHYYMPYNYVTNAALTGRFWTIRTVPRTR